MRVHTLQSSRKCGYIMFYIFFVVSNVKCNLHAKSDTQCPRVSYRDPDVLYGELNYYLGCQTPEFHL